MLTWKWPRRKGSVKTSPLQVGDPTLVVVASGHDEGLPSSTALGEAGFDDPGPVVLRHLLQVPENEREAVVRRCVADGYDVDGSVPDESDADGRALVAVATVTTVDAVSLSRSRSRMASLVSRAGGRVEGWAVLRRADTPVTGSNG